MPLPPLAPNRRPAKGPVALRRRRLLGKSSSSSSTGGVPSDSSPSLLRPVRMLVVCSNLGRASLRTLHRLPPTVGKASRQSFHLHSRTYWNLWRHLRYHPHHNHRQSRAGLTAPKHHVETNHYIGADRAQNVSTNHVEQQVAGCLAMGTELSRRYPGMQSPLPENEALDVLSLPSRAVKNLAVTARGCRQFPGSLSNTVPTDSRRTLRTCRNGATRKVLTSTEAIQVNKSSRMKFSRIDRVQEPQARPGRE